jgi:ADP-ribose pyrophosphatase YjhB (NUDIX family)
MIGLFFTIGKWRRFGMEFLCELNDGDIGMERLQTSGEVRYRLRRACRAVIFDDAGKIAILDVTKLGYHKLPGGGLEPGEDNIAALHREVKEETGVEIEIRGGLGVIIECREQHLFLQFSTCYYANALGKGKPTSFTQEELDDGFMLKWVELDEAIRLMEGDHPVDYVGKFILKRDLLFLRTMKEKLGKFNEMRRQDS